VTERLAFDHIRSKDDGDRQTRTVQSKSVTRLFVRMITDGNVRCEGWYRGQVELNYRWDEFVVILEGQAVLSSTEGKPIPSRVGISPVSGGSRGGVACAQEMKETFVSRYGLKRQALIRS